MATITEDYVSFEVAKLLKEKGFTQEYDRYHSMVYNEKDYEDEMVVETRIVKAGTLSSYPVGVPEPKCYCPTLQMAMKWLREVHNIHIDICSIWDVTHWIYQVFVITPRTASNSYVDEILYTSYEQACDVSIKYCLENLI